MVCVHIELNCCFQFNIRPVAFWWVHTHIQVWNKWVITWVYCHLAAVTLHATEGARFNLVSLVHMLLNSLNLGAIFNGISQWVQMSWAGPSPAKHTSMKSTKIPTINNPVSSKTEFAASRVCLSLIELCLYRSADLLVRKWGVALCLSHDSEQQPKVLVVIMSSEMISVICVRPCLLVSSKQVNRT